VATGTETASFALANGPEDVDGGAAYEFRLQLSTDVETALGAAAWHSNA
jgi:hypothetical protein